MLTKLLNTKIFTATAVLAFVCCATTMAQEKEVEKRCTKFQGTNNEICFFWEIPSATIRTNALSSLKTPIFLKSLSVQLKLASGSYAITPCEFDTDEESSTLCSFTSGSTVFEIDGSIEEYYTREISGTSSVRLEKPTTDKLILNEIVLTFNSMKIGHKTFEPRQKVHHLFLSSN